MSQQRIVDEITRGIERASTKRTTLPVKTRAAARTHPQKERHELTEAYKLLRRVRTQLAGLGGGWARHARQIEKLGSEMVDRLSDLERQGFR